MYNEIVSYQSWYQLFLKKKKLIPIRNSLRIIIKRVLDKCAFNHGKVPAPQLSNQSFELMWNHKQTAIWAHEDF